MNSYRLRLESTRIAPMIWRRLPGPASVIGMENVNSLLDDQRIPKMPDALNHLISETANFDIHRFSFP